jgi:hypothetical protein
MFQRWNIFPSTGEGTEASTLLGPLERARVQGLRLALSKGPIRVDASLPLPEVENRSSFCVFYLFRILDDGQSPKTQWFRPSELFRIFVVFTTEYEPEIYKPQRLYSASYSAFKRRTQYNSRSMLNNYMGICDIYNEPQLQLKNISGFPVE